MKSKKIIFLAMLTLAVSSGLAPEARAAQVQVKSVKAIDGSGRNYSMTVNQAGQEKTLRVDDQSVIVRRVPAGQLAAGDRIWVNQNVTEFKGVNASVNLSPAASKWFGIPRVQKVPKINGYTKAPEKSVTDDGETMMDSRGEDGQILKAVEKTPQGFNLVFAETGKKRAVSKDARILKVTPASQVKAGDRLNIRENSGTYLEFAILN